MGIYINPKCGMDHPELNKIKFLKDHGLPITKAEAKTFFKSKRAGEVLLARVDNGLFSAIAVGYSPDEVAVFTDDRDPRCIKYYICDVDDLKPWVTKEEYDMLNDRKRNGS